jgi:hypothetical protein
MLKVHTLDSFGRMQMYMHDTEHMIYFVDTDYIHQTILLRLPPVFLSVVSETHRDYIVPQEVREAFDKMEQHARSFFSASVVNRPSLLRTTIGAPEHTRTVLDDVGRFVEVIVAIVGIDKSDTQGWDFVYRTVDMRAVDIEPPRLDADLLQTTDLFST